MAYGWREAPKLYKDLSRKVGAAVQAGAKIAAVHNKNRINARLSGEVLRYRSGALRRSVTVTVEPTGKDVAIVARAGSASVRYAATHEYGAVITPKKGPFLKFKIGRGKKGGWVSVRSVTIPARPYMRPSALETVIVLRRSVLEKLREVA